MRNLSMISLCLVFVAFTGSALAVDMGGSLGHDLDALWATAQANQDLENEDAVLLLESQLVTLHPDGTRSTRVHRVVWIGTSMGIRNYADLRVPWDTATSELEVEILRTWMDNRWWPDVSEISETAVVHTLPYAVRTAHDYTNMRETMLLHDGVELPCIMETAYTITEQPAFEYADDLFVMPQRDPAVKVEYQLVAPGGTEVLFEDLNGQAAPVVDNVMGSLVMTWSMEGAPALKMPITAAPERYEAAVVWSTWPDWGTVAMNWRHSIHSATVVSEAMQDTVQGIFSENLDWAPLAGFPEWVNESTRLVPYDAEHWFGRPREATRTWETGYGHSLDRVVLMNAWGGNGGVPEGVWFVGEPGPAIAGDVPRLGGLGRLMYGNIEGKEGVVYDANHGIVISQSDLIGCPVYLFGADGTPTLIERELALRGVDMVLDLKIEPAGEGIWSGEGTLWLQGPFADSRSWTSSPTAMMDNTNSVLSSVLENAEIEACNPIRFGNEETKVGFTFNISDPEEDEHGVKRLVIGSPHGGVTSRLPGDVHLSDQSRESPVFLGGPLSQAVNVSIRQTSDEFGSLPAAFRIENEAGNARLEIEENRGWTTMKRAVALYNERTDADQWPALRALLLEEKDPRHGTIIFE